ncbi:MAG: beta-phosphoglucomutase [Clostridiales bacterium]|nr:beta-phosphoglucomutase [Clostridiales bacterium]
MRYKGIIFDLDGVICHTDQYHYQAWKALADQIGVYFDENINDRLRGVSRMASLDIILEKSEKIYTQEEKENLAATKNEIYKKLLQQMTPADLPSEVKETLDTLHEQGFQLAIGSSSRNTRMILERLGLAGYFDAISDGTNITRSKPDPEVFLKAAAFLGFDPKDCLVVEDAESGIDAAAAGGFDSAGIGTAASYQKTKWKMNAISDLPQIVAAQA